MRMCPVKDRVAAVSDAKDTHRGVSHDGSIFSHDLIPALLAVQSEAETSFSLVP